MTDETVRGGKRIAPDRAHVRSDGEVDADRLLYADAFRRLSGVTQVVTPRDEFVQHDRLTHSLKVAQVARRMAVHLRREAGAPVDPDTVYAASLAHDLGHPPFGHAAERELQGILEGRRNRGGPVSPLASGDVPTLPDSFEGNAQTFRVLTRITFRKEDERAGLNWSLRSLGAVAKYPWERGGHTRPSLADKWGAYGSEVDLLDRVIEEVRALGLWTGERSLEADVMDWSDDIAYAVHDIEDFYRSESIPLGRLQQDDEEWDDYLAFVAAQVAYKGWEASDLERVATEVRRHLPTQPYRGSARNRFEIRAFAIAMTRLLTGGLACADRGLVVPQRNRMAAEILKNLTWRYVINRPDVVMMQRGQQRVVRELLWDLRELLLEHLDTLGRSWSPLPPRLVSYGQLALRDDAAAGYDTVEQRATRAVVDFICSLTDRQAGMLHLRLTGDGSGGIGHDWLTI
ncbi:MAG: dNTP triphosphohydrolase [Actinobacteria bacterium]|nr:dNTP triphosphohydrolase [Actinomycetota bacterium]